MNIEHYPLAPVQKAYISYGNAFAISKNLQFSGKVDVEALRHSVRPLIQRHEILRTSFPMLHGSRVQFIHSPFEMDIGYSDFSDLPPEASQLAFSHSVTEAADAPFDIEKGPLWRASIYRLGPDDYVFNFIFSHAIFDGWSLSNLTREILDAYCSHVSGHASLLPDLPLQFRDYTRLLLARFTDDVISERQAFWRQKLKDYPWSPRAKTTHHFKPYFWRLSSELTREMRNCAKRESASLYTLLMSIFRILMSHVSGQDDLILSCVTSVERNRPELDELIGPFNGIIPVRTSTADDPSLSTLISRVRAAILDGGDHYVPFGSLEGVLPPMNIAFNLLSTVPPVTSYALPGIPARFEVPRGLYTSTDLAPIQVIANQRFQSDNRLHSIMGPLKLNIRMIEIHNEIVGCTWYNSDVFNDQDVRGLMNSYIQLLETAVLDRTRKMSQMVMDLTPSDNARFTGAF
ncbi:MAG: condensation domain-containing protein [Bdellovibrionales bacterium]